RSPTAVDRLERSSEAQQIEDSPQRKVTGHDEFPIENPGTPFQLVGELAFSRIHCLTMAPQHPAEPGHDPARDRILLARKYHQPEKMKGTNPRCRKAPPSQINFRIASATINSVVPPGASGRQRQRSSKNPGICPHAGTQVTNPIVRPILSTAKKIRRLGSPD